MKHFKLMTMLLMVTVSMVAEVQGQVLINPKVKGEQINRVFFDFKSPSAPWNFRQDKLAETLLKDYKFNGIRVSIFGTKAKPAHPEPGVVVAEMYKSEVLGLQLAKKIRPDTIIFASKKLDGKNSFPAWTKDANGVIPEKYAQLLIDYLVFMKEAGLTVDVLGIDNERAYNEGNITPLHHREIVLLLRKMTKKQKLTMPKIIGHEDFAMGRDRWMEQFNQVGGDTMDIFGGHYYPHARYLKRLQSDINYAGKREKWHTELHWELREGDTEMDAAVKALLALWDCTDRGMNGIMWWAWSKDTKSFRGSLMHAATIPLVDAYPIAVQDSDGLDTVDEKMLHTRAFLQDDTITVYALNLAPNKNWEKLGFKLTSGRIVGKVNARQWSEKHPAEGVPATLKTAKGKAFSLDLSPATITVFTFKYKR